MMFRYRSPKTDLTFKDVIEKINLRFGSFGKISLKEKFLRPFELSTVVGGVYMKDEGWSNLHQCETSPQFWVYLDGRSDVLKIHASSSEIKYTKVLAVPKNKKIYRLI